MKTLHWVIIIGLSIALGWFGHQYFADDVASLLSQTPAQEENSPQQTEDDPGEVVCAQVITPAINPETKEIREFPTPCDVPDGWDVIQNDIPGLELEVQ